MQDNCRDCGRKNCICKSLQNQSLAGFSDARDRLRTSAQCEATVLALNDLLNESQKNAMLVIADRDRLRAELSELKEGLSKPEVVLVNMMRGHIANPHADTAKRNDELCAENEKLRAELEATKTRIADDEKERMALLNERHVHYDELTAARRVIDEARKQVPVAYMHNKRADVIHTSVKALLSDFSVNYGPESMLRPIDKSEHYTIALYAAPVPPQPAVSVAGVIAAYECGMQSTDHLNQYAHGTAEHDAFVHGVNHRYALAHMAAQTQHFAVPEAVAKDAARYRFLKDNPAFLYFPSSGIWRLHLNQYSPNGVADTQEEAIDAAILSAADDEVKKCAHVIPCPDVCGDNTNSTATEGRKDE